VRDNRRILTVRHTDIPVCEELFLFPSMDAGPIVDYSQSELLDSLQLVRSACVTCCYSADLVRYVELLEIAAAKHMYTMGNATMFDVAALRTTITVPLEAAYVAFGSTMTFCNFIWPCFLEMFRRFVDTRCIIDQCIDMPDLDVYSVDTSIMDNVAAEIVRVCDEQTYTETSPSIRRVIQYHLRPGERHLWLLSHVGSTISNEGIISEVMGPSYMKVLNESLRPTPAAGVREHLAKMNHAIPDPLNFSVCMYDMFVMQTDDSAGAEWNEHYCRLEPDIFQTGGRGTDIQFRTNNHPMLCQLHNHWQIIFQRRAYWFNSFIAALIFFLRLLRYEMKVRFSRSPMFSAAAECSFYRRLMRMIPDENENTEAALALACDRPADLYARIRA